MKNLLVVLFALLTINTARSSCVERGYYGSEECHKCPKGTYGGGTVSVDGCLACPEGKSSAEGSSTLESCTLCVAGKFGVEPDCVNCPNGQISSSAGQSSCEPCENGLIPNKAHTKCVSLACEAGQFNLDGECEDCEAGYYLPKGDSREYCLECPTGYFSNRKAALCTSCPSGTFSYIEGQANCDVCEAGHYSPTGASECTVCAAGKYSPRKSGSCIDCPVGTYSPHEGSDECYFCDGAEVGASSCPHGTGEHPSPSGTPPPHQGTWHDWPGEQSNSSMLPHGNHTWESDDDRLKGDDYMPPEGGGNDDKVLNGDDDYNPGKKHGKHHGSHGSDDDIPNDDKFHNSTGRLPGFSDHPTAQPTFGGDPRKNSEEAAQKEENGVIVAAVLVPFFVCCGLGAFAYFFFVMKQSAKDGSGEQETPYEAWMRAKRSETLNNSSAPVSRSDVESTINPLIANQDTTTLVSPNLATHNEIALEGDVRYQEEVEHAHDPTVSKDPPLDL